MKQFGGEPLPVKGTSETKSQSADKMTPVSKVDMQVANKTEPHAIKLGAGTDLVLTEDILAMIDYQVARTTLFQAKKVSKLLFW